MVSGGRLRPGGGMWGRGHPPTPRPHLPDPAGHGGSVVPCQRRRLGTLESGQFASPGAEAQLADLFHQLALPLESLTIGGGKVTPGTAAPCLAVLLPASLPPPAPRNRRFSTGIFPLPRFLKPIFYHSYTTFPLS